MALTTPLKAIAGYFNKDETGKNITPLRDFANEVKALSDAEKQWFAEEICKITGDTLATA